MSETATIIENAIRLAKLSVWNEVAEEFEENWDGADTRYGNPSFLAWLKRQARNLEDA